MNSYVKVYEFSSGVKVRKILGGDRDIRWEFDQYLVDTFTHNSFVSEQYQPEYFHELSTIQEIPNYIYKAIKNDYLHVKPSHSNIALTGRYIDDWAVLTICDQLLGRPNEVYRYFCVHTKECHTDPMIGLLDWYLYYIDEHQTILKVNPDPQRSNGPYSESNRIQKQYTLSDQAELIQSSILAQSYIELESDIDTPHGDKEWISALRTLRQICSNLRDDFHSLSWALNVPNIKSVQQDNLFNLIYSIDRNWLYSPIKQVANHSTLDIRQTKMRLDLLTTCDSEKIPSNIYILFQLIPVEAVLNIGYIFDDMGLPQLIKRPNPASIRLLILQGIFCPDRINELGVFIVRSGRYSKDVQLFRKFEQEIINFYIKYSYPRYQSGDAYRLCQSLMNFVYHGAWQSLEFCLSLSDKSVYLQDFLLFEQKPISIQSYDFNRSQKLRVKGLWSYVLKTKVRADFHEYIYRCSHSIKSPDNSFLPESAKQFFNKFFDQESLKQNIQFFRFFLNLWSDDPIILSWAYDKIYQIIPKELHHEISKLVTWEQENVDPHTLESTFFGDRQLSVANYKQSLEIYQKEYLNLDFFKYKLAQRFPKFKKIYFR